MERQRQIKEAEQKEKERLEKIEAERLEKIRKEKEKQARLDQYRLEKLAKEEQERREAEIKEREKKEREEREAREAAEKERLKQERLAKEAYERELKEKEKQKKKLTKFLDRVTSQCLQKQICTYVGTGNMASMQFMYVCLTCKKIDVCEMCQSFGCHAGHDIYIKVTDLDKKRTQLKREGWCACSQNGHECKRTQEGPILSPRFPNSTTNNGSAGDSDSSEQQQQAAEVVNNTPKPVTTQPVARAESIHPVRTAPGPRGNFFTNRGDSARNIVDNPSPRNREAVEQPPTPSGLNLGAGRTSKRALGNEVNNKEKDDDKEEDKDDHKPTREASQSKTRRPLVSHGQGGK